MTGQAEKIRERHRGWRRAQPASESRIAALNTFGLRYVVVDDFNVIVEGRYHLNLAMSFWRADDNSAQGYLVKTLRDEIRGKQLHEHHEKPATDRDSVTAIPSDNPDPSDDNQASAVVAESVAGSYSLDAGSASLLPAGPWS